MQTLTEASSFHTDTNRSFQFQHRHWQKLPVFIQALVAACSFYVTDTDMGLCFSYRHWQKLPVSIQTLTEASTFHTGAGRRFQFPYRHWHKLPVFIHTLTEASSFHTYTDRSFQCPCRHWQKLPVFIETLTEASSFHTYTDRSFQLPCRHWQKLPVFIETLAEASRFHTDTDRTFSFHTDTDRSFQFPSFGSVFRLTDILQLPSVVFVWLSASIEWHGFGSPTKMWQLISVLRTPRSVSYFNCRTVSHFMINTSTSSVRAASNLYHKPRVSLKTKTRGVKTLRMTLLFLACFIEPSIIISSLSVKIRYFNENKNIKKWY